MGLKYINFILRSLLHDDCKLIQFSFHFSNQAISLWLHIMVIAVGLII